MTLRGHELESHKQNKSSGANTDTPLPAAYRITELGPLPEDWRVVRLGEVVEEIVERVSDSNDSSAYNLPVLSLTKNEGLILQTERFNKRIATDDVSNYKIVRKGQIVYNPYVIWEGAIHILKKYEAGLVSPVYPVIKAKETLADPFYLDAWLRTPLAIAAYNRFASGAVNRRRAIRKRDFLEIQLPLPPLPEQRAIAHVLRTVQEAKEATERVIAALRELKKSLMRHLFTYGPVPVNNTDGVELQETEVGMLPKHWRVERLGEVVKQTQYGISRRGVPKGKVPILRMNNLVDGKINTSDLQYLNLDERETKRFYLQKGDILFNRTNSHELVGKTAVFDLDGNFVFASYLIRLKVDSELATPEFLNFCMNWEGTQQRLKYLASRGVSQSNINATKLKGFSISLPPLPEQREIVHILQTVGRKIEVEEQQKAALEALFKTLLHDLMTARRRLPAEFVAQFERGSEVTS